MSGLCSFLAGWRLVTRLEKKASCWRVAKASTGCEKDLVVAFALGGPSRIGSMRAKHHWLNEGERWGTVEEQGQRVMQVRG
jgi:hypothetical protein